MSVVSCCVVLQSVVLSVLLHCVVLRSVVSCLFCCIALRCVVLRSVVSPLCNVSVELHCVVIRCVVLRCDPLNFVALCCVALLTSSPFLVFRLC